MKIIVAGILILMLVMACKTPPTPTATPIALVATSTPTVQSLATPTPTIAPSPTITVTATSTPTGTPTATPVPESILPVPPDRDMFALAQRLILKSQAPIPHVVNPEPVSYSQGRKDTFRVVDFQSKSVSTITATLQLVTPHAYWYVDDNVSFSMDTLKKSAQTFEDTVYPAVTGEFGPELVPGVDNDVHLTILNTPLSLVAGYFSSMDEYPEEVQPYSNQREMIYIDTASLNQGGADYLGVLAHEFTHAIQFRTDPNDETWINEGLAEFGRETAGYAPVFRNAFLSSTLPISLVQWPLDVSGASTRSYGAASLFMDYLAHLYGHKSLSVLMDEPADGILGVKAYLKEIGAGKSFHDIFADWVVANYLNDPSGGAYGYNGLGNTRVSITRTLSEAGILSDNIPQYAAAYYDLRLQAASVNVEFQGQSLTSLLPSNSPSGTCWWSNHGDAIDSTLTGRFSLPVEDKLTLSYSLWHGIEDGWDFGYVEVSTDGGLTWDVLKGQHTVNEDALGNAYGPGYTGNSNGWLKDEVDLTPYAGKEVLLRFEYITDESINGPGMCLTDIAIPEMGFSDNANSGNSVWEAQGFLNTDNRIPVDYVLRVIEISEGYTVRDIPLNKDRSATFTIDGLGAKLEHAVIVVAGMSEGNSLPTTVQINVSVPTSQ